MPLFSETYIKCHNLSATKSQNCHRALYVNVSDTFLKGSIPPLSCSSDDLPNRVVLPLDMLVYLVISRLYAL